MRNLLIGAWTKGRGETKADKGGNGKRGSMQSGGIAMMRVDNRPFPGRPLRRGYHTLAKVPPSSFSVVAHHRSRAILIARHSQRASFTVYVG